MTVDERLPPSAEVLAEAQRFRIRAALIAFTAGLLILGLKAQAYRMTHSTALLSDALESIVNVIAALFALGAVLFAGRPADRNHPYGHGKIEYFSAVFEGGMISLAAVMIIYEAAHALHAGPHIRSLGPGLAVSSLAGAINGGLGLYLVRAGRSHGSKSLEADGHHVLSDFFTTVGILIALCAVKLTRLEWLDPLIAICVGLWLARTGVKLVKESSGALLDEEDTVMITRFVDAFNEMQMPHIIGVHSLRALRAGRFTHAQAHVVIPEFYDVLRGHELVESFGRALIKRTGLEGELTSHMDPCRRSYCGVCAEKDCPIRGEPFKARLHLSIDAAIASDPDS